MKYALCFCLSLCVTASFLPAQSSPVAPVPGERVLVSQKQNGSASPEAQARILDEYGKLPLRFEANDGQTNAQVKFLSRTGGYTLFLTGEAVLTLNGKNARTGGRGVLRMKLHNANPAAKVSGSDPLAGASNYFVGNDPAKWRTNVPAYAKVKYEAIYAGIDLVYYGNQRQLEFDFIVAPGANPHRIAFDVGNARPRQDPDGDLVLTVGEDEIRWHKPVAYQEKYGKRQEIAARYVITDGNRVEFEVAKYDVGRALYIDPLIYSTYVGGSGFDNTSAIALDSSGSAYVAGWTNSTDFPTLNPSQPSYGGGYSDIFVTKLNPAGSALVYSTYLGGNGEEYGYQGIAVDSAGNTYLTGTTYSADFPTTPGAFQTTCDRGNDCKQHGDGFVSKLNPAGSALVYSTYLGGSYYDYSFGIAVDPAGSAYLTGETFSVDFPAKNPLQSNKNGFTDAFVSKLNPAGSALVYSTYLGGSEDEHGSNIAVDSAGNAYIAGGTNSPDFPTKNAFQPALAGISSSDAFVTKINATGSALVYSTYLGGSEVDGASGVAVDAAGDAYVVGTTFSTDFPTKNPLQSTNHGRYDVFVTEFNPSGEALIYSTYLGGAKDESGNAIAVDASGNAYVTGYTKSSKFPVTSNAFQRICNRGTGCTTAGDAFVSKISPGGSALVYSTFLGGKGWDGGYGIAVGGSGNAYVTGGTGAPDFPVTSGAFQTACNANNGCSDAFVTKMQTLAATTITLTSAPNPSAHGQAVVFTATVTSVVGAPPDGETVSFLKGITVLGTGTLSQGTASFSTSALKVGTTTVKAVYGGDSNFDGSKSNAVKQVVQ